MMRSAFDTVSWSRADASYECGSCASEVMIDVTSTLSPPISAASEPYTLVDATTLSVPSPASDAEGAAVPAQPARTRDAPATSAAAGRSRRVMAGVYSY